mmetsp:Transcript_54744/g.113140  ORF Transcript_54744/g.113140 Transcript_54744/m.113140 type:complete len:84 (+) Transcript_54744:459-710(+)
MPDLDLEDPSPELPPPICARQGSLASVFASAHVAGHVSEAKSHQRCRKMLQVVPTAAKQAWSAAVPWHLIAPKEMDFWESLDS